MPLNRNELGPNDVYEIQDIFATKKNVETYRMSGRLMIIYHTE